ncbi:hypothetical protein [Streptosporangium subroseum]|uniref:hypothetical protein n=1 Tax=Streptosporangium subroseum TaxID=106412 RepID=UPI003089A649|nr:hypothetical protein OHB15_24060 [Streptosporangium subroseum]
MIGWGLAYGFAVSALFSAVLLGGALAARDFMVQDYPPAIRNRYGPKSPRGQRVTRIAGVVVAAGVIAILVTAMIHLYAIAPEAGFVTALAYAATILITFNVFDLIVLDWLVVVRWRPSIVVLPGTEGMDAYDDMSFHLVGFAKGMIVCLSGALISAVAFTLITTVL